ncbi:sigma-70 family RNA polymerase sigma factor [Chitinophaga sp. RAB17]|uniref:sigma-70 family RNA polymerase sigma factor n=1 Tax=Chitinophaga sp. RAB17 TaxID=3233049 RepID=UPI003F8E7295
MEDFSAIEVYVREWLNGSDLQFKPVFHYCFPRLLRYAARFINDHTLSEELAMNVLFKVWQQKERMAGIDDFNSYLFIMMRNEVVSMTRRKKMLTQEISPDHDYPAIQPSDKLHYRELVQRYQQCLDKLPPRRREAFVLNREKGLSYAEIASQLNISVYTVQNHIASSLKMLRTELQDYADLLPFVFLTLLPMLSVY